MKKIIKVLKTNCCHKKYFILVFVFAILLLPNALTLPSETDVRGIITTLGFDLEGEELEVSAQIFVPTASSDYKEKFDIVTVKSESAFSALSNIAVKIGKKIGLAHAQTIVFGESMLNFDISGVLDYFVRINNLSNSAVLVATNNTAKNFIETSAKQTVDGLVNLRRISFFNQNNLLSTDISLESFFKGYYGPNRASVMSFIELKEDKEQEKDIEDNKEKSPKFKIENNGEAMVVREGKICCLLDDFDMKAKSFLNPKVKTGYIQIDNVTNNNFKDATLVYNITKKTVKQKSKFVDGVPTIETDYVLNLKLASINAKDEARNFLESDANYLDAVIKEKIKMQITNSTMQFVEKLQKINADIIGGVQSFYRSNRTRLQKYYPTDLDKNEMFKDIIYKKPTFHYKIEV